MNESLFVGTYPGLTRPMLDFLTHCVKSRLNILISGGTGASVMFDPGTFSR